MATLLDGQVGFLKESVYNTPVTVTRFLEVLEESKHNLDPMPIQGLGLRVGSRYIRTARRLAGTGRGDLTLKAEITSKGFGTLFELVSGTSTSTLVSGSTFQQVFTPVITGTVMPSSTIQFGIPRLDSGGTVDAYTYSGCVAKSFEIDATSDGTVTISVDFWSAAVATATGLATASYPTTPTLYTDGASDAGATFGGTLTTPTTVALASGGTTSANIRSWQLSVDLGLNERPKLGGWNQPSAGMQSAKLKLVQDYDATTTRALQISQAPTSFTGFYTGGALSTGTERFEVDIPAMIVDDGSFGQLTAGDGSIPDVSFTVGDNLTDKPWYAVFRTADATL